MRGWDERALRHVILLMPCGPFRITSLYLPPANKIKICLQSEINHANALSVFDKEPQLQSGQATFDSI